MCSAGAKSMERLAEKPAREASSDELRGTPRSAVVWSETSKTPGLISFPKMVIAREGSCNRTVITRRRLKQCNWRWASKFRRLLRYFDACRRERNHLRLDYEDGRPTFR